jgi:ankyrin repeat protein
LNIADKDGLTPVDVAAYIGHLNIVKTLAEQGANLLLTMMV